MEMLLDWEEMRGWWRFSALDINVSIEPARDGTWRIHGLNRSDLIYATEGAAKLAAESCLRRELSRLAPLWTGSADDPLIDWSN